MRRIKEWKRYQLENLLKKLNPELDWYEIQELIDEIKSLLGDE